jgi:hypothetical protein
VRVFLVSLALLLTLIGCSRETDTFAPQIVITKPANESVTPNSRLTIEGYVWDDKGIQKLVLNGTTDLLAKGPLAAQRGRKIVKFSFPASPLAGDKVSYELRAVDTKARSSTREIKVTVDTQKPTLSIQTVDSQLTTVAVSGLAKDNQKVNGVSVNGDPLNISPGQSVSFYAVIPRSRRSTIVFTAKDGVGNTVSQTIPVPLPPLPPPPPPETVTDANGVTTAQPTTRRRRRRSRVTTPPAVVAPAPTPAPVTPIGTTPPR